MAPIIDTKSTQEVLDNFHLKTYNRFPVTFVEGEGCYLYDENGKKYLDTLAGIAVNSLGHNHHKLTEAIMKQAVKLIHVSNLFYNQPQANLASKLVELSGMERAFFCNSGLEANEAAIKIARKYGKEHGKTGNIISFSNCFHGRSIATIALGKTQYQEGFEPMPSGFKMLPYNDIKALKEISDDDIAVFIEVVQGEGGIVLADQEFVDKLAKICKKKNILIIADEIQSGIGRTGEFLAYQHYGLNPDIVTLAKGLGGGVPIGAVLTNSTTSDVLAPGNHGTTFGGNPLACAAGNAVLETIESEKLVEHAKEIGQYLLQKLYGIKDIFPSGTEIRGIGLMIGIDIKTPCRGIALELLEKGLVVSATANTVLRLVPPLIINRVEIDEAIEKIKAVFQK